MTTLPCIDFETLPTVCDWISPLQDCEKKTVILTPNRRLAATLHQLYREHQLAKQKTQWDTPLIIPLDRWVETLFVASFTESSNDHPPTLLNTHQTAYLWRMIILEHEELQNLIQVKETAKLMQSAWELLISWRLTLTIADCEEYQDYLLLLSCMQQYESICEKNDWLDEASLPGYIMTMLENQPTFKDQLPKHILLSGFNELSPLFALFFQTLKTFDCEITLISSQSEQQDTMVVTAASNTHEYQLMAQWAKAKISENKDNRIACIVPNLTDVRDQVKKTFEEVFFQEKQYCYDTHEMPFNISAGKRLSEYNIIKIALHLLSIHDHIISSADLSPLLHSSFIGHYFDEAAAREAYALLLAKWNIHLVSLEKNTGETESHYALERYCPQLFSMLQRISNKLNHFPAKQPIDAWIECFNDCLEIVGWPGEKSLDSHLFQVTDAWLQSFYKMASIQVVSSALSYSEAYSLLVDFTENTVFQPKSPLAPIQILGTLEATGIPFDCIWLSGLDDITWPPKPKPHPFIPKKLQTAYQMPHATSLREYQYCLQLMQQFKSCSKLLVCSYATSKDQLERYMSPLLYDFPLAHELLSSADDYLSNFQKIVASKRLDYFHDECGPVIDKKLPIKGGAYAIKAQSHCPFKAYAEWRLSSRVYPIPSAALQPSEKGLVLHHAMSLIWGVIKNHSALIALNERALNQLILKSIKNAIASHVTGKIKSSRYLNLEKKRLFKLIKNWMSLEKERPWFQVSAIEEKLTATIADIEFSFRVDRIDQLANSQKMIIDYKSGRYNKAQDWLTERPGDPQLIMYLLCQPNETAAISFAQIHANETAFKGVSCDDTDIKGVKPIHVMQKEMNWNTQLDHWHNVISRLCNEFASGDARLHPVNQDATCSQCQQQSFCRIKETVNA